MNSRFLRFLVVTLQTLAFIIGIGISVYGIVVSTDGSGAVDYITTVVRIVALVLVTLAYYKNNVSINNPGNLFTILYLLFASLTEMQILSFFTRLTGWSILPPRVNVRLVMFSQFMMFFSVLGFSLFNQNNEHGAANRFMLIGGAGVLFLSLTLPAPQDVLGVWSMTAPLVVLTILCVLSVIAHMILIASDLQRSWILRQVATIMLIVGSYLVAVFTSFAYITVGTALFAIGAIILMIMTLRNSVIL